MGKPVKYILITFAFLGILIIGAVLAVTTFVDVESYKPKIEQLFTDKTGYPLHLGGEISLSLFPWVGLGFTDLQLDNPEGFSGKNFVRIKGFQARLKVMPLLSRKIEMSKFVVIQPEITLEKNVKGVWNWQKLTEINNRSAAATANVAPKKQEESGAQSRFALESLVVGEFSITDGRVGINDLTTKEKHELSKCNIQLDDVSLDKAVQLVLEAQLDGKPLAVKGSIGPLGSDPGAGKVNLDLLIRALDVLNVKVSGALNDLKGPMSFDLALNMEPFSPRRALDALGIAFPIKTTDPKAIDKLSLQAALKGTNKQLVLSAGRIVLDDSTIDLEVTAKDFSRPDLAMKVVIDSLDLDRYLPPAQTGEASAPGQAEATSAQTASAGEMNYEPLRKLVLKTVLQVGELKVHGGTAKNLGLDITGKNGLFTIHSLGMDLYQGNIAATGKINVQKNIPDSSFELTMQNVQAGPLVKDFVKKDIIEGMLKAELAVQMQGDKGDLIKKSLKGKGDLLFLDGALIGLDLAQMARNIKSGFTLEQQGEKPKTDFAELHAPFTITNGLVNTPETILRSPFIRVVASGDADLVSETLKMKVKPTVVGTMKGQGDTENRSGLTIPVLIGGTFSAPKFSPDLEALVKDRLPSEKDLTDLIKTGKVPAENKDQLKKEAEQAKGLLKGLLGK